MKNGIIVILSPMDCECELLVSRLAEKNIKHTGGYVLYEGKLEEQPVVIVRCLMGIANSAVCAYFAVERYSPECIILQGTSGAHDESYNVNDIVIAEKIVPLTNCVSAERKKGEGTNPFEWGEFGLQYYSKKADSIEMTNEFLCDKELLEVARRVEYKHGKVISGTVGCADMWNKEADLILHYRKTKGTDCEAMEGTGVAMVCSMFDVPMLEIRVISNNELHEKESFSPESAENCQKFVIDFIKLLKQGTL